MPHHPDILDAIENHQLVKLAELLARTKEFPFDARNDNEETYLHVATKKYLKEGAPYGLDIINYLLRININPEAVDSQGKTAFQACDIDAVDGQYRCTPLQHSVRQYPEFQILFEQLIKNGADLNKPDQDGRTPIIDAAFFGKPELLIKLVDLGANLYVGYESYITPNPLLSALNSKSTPRENAIQCVQYLLDHYAAIGLSFAEGDLDNIELNGKVLLSAQLPDDLAKHNPSVEKAIKTFTELKAAVAIGSISIDQLKAIKIACCHIRNNLLLHSKKSASLPLIKIINQLDITWPELKPIGIEIPPHLLTNAGSDDPIPSKNADKSGGCAIM